MKTFKITEENLGTITKITFSLIALSLSSILLLGPHLVLTEEEKSAKHKDLNTLSEPEYEKVLCQNTEDPHICIEKRRKKVEDWRKENNVPEPSPTTLTQNNPYAVDPGETFEDPAEAEQLIEFCRDRPCRVDFHDCHFFPSECEEA